MKQIRVQQRRHRRAREDPEDEEWPVPRQPRRHGVREEHHEEEGEESGEPAPGPGERLEADQEEVTG